MLRLTSQTWVHISEPPFFQVYVTRCPEGFLAAFLAECGRRGLAQLHLRFNSKAQPSAHIQAQFDAEAGRFQMFPIFDVPAALPRGFCRILRDF